MAEAVVRARTDLDASGFQRGVASMSAGAAQLKGMIAGAFSVGAVVSFGKSIVNMASDLKDASQITGLATESLQALEQVARESGGDIDKLRNALVKIRDIQDNPSGATLKAFERLGIDAVQLATSSMPQLIEAMAKGYAATNDLGAISDIVGTRNLLGFEDALKRVAENGLGALTQSMKDAGRVMSEDLVDQLDEAEDRFAGWWTSLKIITATGIKDLIDGTRVGMREVSTFWEGVFGGKSMREASQDSVKAGDELFASIMADEEKRDNERRKRRESREKSDAARRLENALLDLTPEERGRLSATGPSAPAMAKSMSESIMAPIEKSARFDQLRQIGARGLGGSRSPLAKTEEHLKWIRETADKQLSQLQEIARGGSKF